VHSSYRSDVPSSVKASTHGGGGTRDGAQDRRRGIAGGAPFPCLSHAAGVVAPATSVPCVRPERYASHREGAIGAGCAWPAESAPIAGCLPRRSCPGPLELLAELPLSPLQNWRLEHRDLPDDAVVERIVRQFYTSRPRAVP
jgi:hypothetical protein